MEKPGMEGRFVVRGGLLMRPAFTRYLRIAAIVFGFLLATFYVSAESASGGAGPDEPLTLLVSVSPDRPSIEAALVITILVDYSDPERTMVRPPILPAAFSLDRVRSEPRRIRGTSGADERWTAIEFTFSIQAAGEYRLGPFEVEVPQKRAITAPLNIRVAGADGSASAPSPVNLRKLEWRALPSVMRSGESAEVILALMGGGSFTEATVSAAAPENAVLETLPLRNEDRTRGIVGRFRLTALASPGFRLPSVVVTLNGESALSASGGWIAVSPAAGPRGNPPRSSVAPASSSGIAAGEPSRASLKPLFPDLTGLPAPFAASAERPLELARAAWARGDYAVALAILRAAERDSLVGFAVASVRREAERALDLENTPDEGYAPTKVLIALAAASLLFALLRFFFSSRVTSDRRRGYMFTIICFALAFLSIGRLLAIRLDAAGFLGRGIAAVTPACTVYRIPEADGGISTEFSDGQPVRLRSSAGSWIYAEAPDGQAGWVQGDRMIRY